MALIAAKKKVSGDGKLAYRENAEKLNKDQEKLLLDYMRHYYESLAELKPKDPGALFSADAKDQIENDKQILTALCGIRKMQRTDLALLGYSFTLTVQSITEEDGALSVRTSEDSTQNFKAYPGVDSKSFGVIHTFVLSETKNGWRLREHRQGGSLNRLVRGLSRWRPGDSPAVQVSGGQSAANQVSLLLKKAESAVKLRTTQGNAKKLSGGNVYDRKAAVAYARKWAGARNDNWPSYDRYGGNCQNFTSQALLAGGIPMDYMAPGQWKWYGDTPNGSFSAAGRSPAWSGVGEFLAYVENNSGYGLVAVADAPYYSGEEGDIIHLGADGDWRHTVIITKVMKNKDGDTVDYLIASNTANLLDFPASAYYYTQQMLIKINGWNG
jgi:hypothetical protein